MKQSPARRDSILLPNVAAGPGRRAFLGATAWSLAAFATPGLMAEALSLTPRQTEGPFYPDRLPLDTDNDLLILNDSLTPAVGQITHLAGQVLNPSGEPIRNAVVEIWQVDGNGVYLHTADQNAKRDANFQGFGRFLTDSQGRYYFRTVKPVPYPGRTPHIHFAIYQHGKRMLTTQCYVRGEDRNQNDGIYRSLGDRADLVTLDFASITGSTANELQAKFDIVIGATPEDRETPRDAPPPRPRRS